VDYVGKREESNGGEAKARLVVRRKSSVPFPKKRSWAFGREYTREKEIGGGASIEPDQRRKYERQKNAPTF
jgi:hypothetical protein